MTSINKNKKIVKDIISGEIIEPQVDPIIEWEKEDTVKLPTPRFLPSFLSIISMLSVVLLLGMALSLLYFFKI